MFVTSLANLEIMEGGKGSTPSSTTQFKMKNILKNKIFLFSLALLTTGIVFGYCENKYYQYVDTNGVLVESWFMPLSFLFIFLGGIGLLAIIVKAIWSAIREVVPLV